MLACVPTLRFDQRIEAFYDQPLREFLATREVLAVREHFFQCNHVPYMAVMVTYAVEPPTAVSASRVNSQGRRVTDWRAQVAEADLPLFDALRDWRAERSRRDGVAPYMVCTNSQLVEMVKTRPQSLTKLGTIDGIGKAKLEKYGQEILALLAWPRGSTAFPVPSSDNGGSSAPASTTMPERPGPVDEDSQVG